MKKLITTLMLSLFPLATLAHPGHTDTAHFLQGFLHPITGIDHLLAMLAVGIWAAQQTSNLRWVAPCSFIMLMLAGAMLATTSVSLYGVELGIASSIVVLGIAIARSLRIFTFASAAVLGMFAMFHGYAHGSEANNLNASYVVGMLLATSTLHVTGMLFMLLGKRFVGHKAVRYTGASIALSGIALVAL